MAQHFQYLIHCLAAARDQFNTVRRLPVKHYLVGIFQFPPNRRRQLAWYCTQCRRLAEDFRVVFPRALYDGPINAARIHQCER
jgi:hypothetical protein